MTIADKITKFKEATETIIKFPTQQKHDEYLLLLNDIEFELSELESKTPIQKELTKNKISMRVDEIIQEWIQTAFNKAINQADLEYQDEVVRYKTKEALMSQLKTLVNIGERNYYHVKNQLAWAVRTEAKTKNHNDVLTP